MKWYEVVRDKHIVEIDWFLSVLKNLNWNKYDRMKIKIRKQIFAIDCLFSLDRIYLFLKVKTIRFFFE